MWPDSLKPNNLTNRGYCSVWKFPFSNQENTALTALWLTDPFPPTALQSATSEGLLLPPSQEMLGNFLVKPPESKRMPLGNPQVHAWPGFLFSRKETFTRELRARRHPQPGPARFSSQPLAALGSLPTLLHVFCRSQGVRARGPCTVARDWGLSPSLSRGAHQVTWVFSGHRPNQLPELARSANAPETELRRALFKRTQQRYSPI